MPKCCTDWLITMMCRPTLCEYLRINAFKSFILPVCTPINPAGSIYQEGDELRQNHNCNTLKTICLEPVYCSTSGVAYSGRRRQQVVPVEAAPNTNGLLQNLIELDAIRSVGTMLYDPQGRLIRDDRLAHRLPDRITAMIAAMQIHLYDCKSANPLTDSRPCREAAASHAGAIHPERNGAPTSFIVDSLSRFRTF